MRERIVIHTRSVRPAGFGSAGYQETYDAGLAVWVTVSTIDDNGQVQFDGVDIAANKIIKFTVRYRSWITAENIIKWRGESYRILTVVNPDARGQYTVMYCALLGDSTKGANT